MTWAIEWTDQALRDLSGLDGPVAQRIVRKLEQSATNPPRTFARIVGGDESKLRVGDYRVLAVLLHESRTIVVERVDHRSRIYRRRP